MLPAWLGPAGLFPDVALPSPTLSSAPPPQLSFQESLPLAGLSPTTRGSVHFCELSLPKYHLEGKSMNN